MKMVKSLILGSAAGLVAMSGAQAADLPVKAKAVEYVKICSLYGAGFYYIPGTDTCLKIGGFIRVDVLENTNSDASGNLNGAGGAANRFTDGYLWRSREDMTFDTRTATEYGVVRTFSEVVFSWTDDNYAANPAAPGSSVYSALGGSATVSAGSAGNNATSGAVAAGTLGVYYAFVQFAGFTMGKAISPFSAPWTNYPGNNFDGLVGGGGTVTGVNQFIYTWQFGNGVSVTVGAQDQTQYYQAGVNNVSAGGTYGTSDYANTISPDFVANVAVDQAWGYFQASVALHDNHAAYYGATEPTGHPDDKWGWAGQLALSIKNIPTGPGDVINMQAVYTDGATRYNIQDLSTAGAAQYYSGTSLPGAYQSFGFGMAPDTIFGAGTQQQLIQTWGFRAGYTHNWDAYWSTSVYGAYAQIHYGTDAVSLICGGTVNGIAFGGSVRALTPAGSGTAITTCNPNYNIGQVGIITRWTPVKNLTFSADLTYQMLDQNYVGTVSASSGSIGKPAAIYELKDQNAISMLLRAQRNF
jgi:Porin subfamily